MPKRYIRFVLIALLQWIPFCLSAQDSTQQRVITKANYQKAKLELESMLDGKQRLNYEQAIFLIENAWWDNRIDPIKFQAMLERGIENIRQIMTYSKFEPKPRVEEWGHTTIWDKLDEKYKKDKGYSKSLIANYAIYKYMTDTFSFMEQNKIFIHEPYYYSTSDPMGSNDWTNTQVVSLMQKHIGNCYAFVSLFKIYAERLHTDAVICSAPSHVYICHSDEDATLYNIELSSRAFPSTGTISTLTHTTQAAAENEISLRQLDLKQSVALCLVYLAKGYEHKLGIQADDFIWQCAEKALQYDVHNLNALLLKREVLEKRVLALNKSITQLKDNQDYKDLEQLTTKLYQLGYKEMPLDMKNLLIQQWSRDSSVLLVKQNYSDVPVNKSVKNPTRNFNLAWGIFEEEIKNKPIERYGRFLYDTKLHRIIGIVPEQRLYNDYSFDPVAFAMNVDPLAHKFPWQSPYSAFDNSPIWKNDPSGKSGVVVIDKQSKTVTIFSTMHFYGPNASMALAVQTAGNVQQDWNAACGTVKIGDVQYNVQFSIQPSYITSNATLQSTSEKSTYKDNFIYVGTRNPDNGSTGSITHGSFAFYNINDLNGGHSESHEMGHGYGPDHPTDAAGNEVQDVRNYPPSIMWPRNTIVPDAYAQPGTNILDPAKRQVTQFDINNLHLDQLNYNSDGKANLGSSFRQFMGDAEEGAARSPAPQSSGSTPAPAKPSWEAAPGGGYLIH